MRTLSISFISLALSTSAFAAPARGPAQPVSPAPLNYLTTADMAKIGDGAGCAAHFNGRPIYATDGTRGVVRFASKPGVPGKLYRLNMIDPNDSDHPGASSSAQTPNFPVDEDLSFTVSIVPLPRAKPVQNGEEEWATPSRLIINGTTGPAWASLRVSWVCGA